jgi:flagellar biosynthetic protein FliQ
VTDQTIIDLGAKTIWVALKVAAPALLATLFTGLLVSVFQAATQINEQTLTFIPKVIIMTIALVVFGPWILETMTSFTTGLFNLIPMIAR